MTNNATPAATTPPDRARRGSIPYEPALDGLRGVAMIAIAAYHSGMAWAPGAFFALDSFFVLSGYLITRLLLAEWKAGETIGLAAFWARRARRLLPAMLVTLAGVCLYAAWVASPQDLARIRSDVLSTLFYVNNWWQIAQGHSYFDAFQSPSPLHHAWSLSLEEQWYVVWPLVVTWVLARWRSATALGWLCLAVAAVSALVMLALYVPGEDPSRVYYGTDTRAQEILIGAALACAVHTGWLPGRVATRIWVALGVAGALALGWIWHTASDTAPWVYQGGFAIVSLVVAVVILAASQPGPNPLRSLLGWSPFRWLGMISYGFYLWHWPVFLVVTREETGLEGNGLFVLRLAVTLAIAAASYAWVERPIRRGALTGRIALGLAVVATLSLAAATVVATQPAASSASPLADLPPAPDRPSLAEAGGPLRVLIVGDSVAWSLGNGFLPSVESHYGVAVDNRAMPGCGLTWGRHRRHGKVFGPTGGNACRSWPQQWQRYVETLRPDVAVALVGGWDVFDREVEGEWLGYGTPAFDRYLLGQIEQATRILGAHGAQVVWLTTAHFAARSRLTTEPPVENERWRTEHLNALLRAHAAAESGASIVELGRFVCGRDACDAVRDGVAMRADGVHLSRAGAVLTARWLGAALHDLHEVGTQRD